MTRHTTEIELLYPYNQDWKKGYIVTNSENRKTVILYNNPSDRSSTQYARYLLATKLGRYLTKEETVDHIDGDKTNDSLENLQIMSLGDNIRKTCLKPLNTLICPICGSIFKRSNHQLANKKERWLKGLVTCSRKCGYKQTSRTLKEHSGRDPFV